MRQAAGLPLFERLAPAQETRPDELERVRTDLIARVKTLKPRSRERIVMEATLAEITLYLLRR